MVFVGKTASCLVHIADDTGPYAEGMKWRLHNLVALHIMLQNIKHGLVALNSF